MSVFTAARIRLIAVSAGALAMASCTTAPPPVLNTTALAPPPMVTVPPLRPSPPFGAAMDTQVPVRTAYGARDTINTGLTSTEALWNLRSAWNVAALNCLGPRYQPISDGYRTFLESYEKSLASANTELDAQYRRDHGGDYRRTRDTHSTRVYNYFALPPARTYFCEATLDMAQRYQAAPDADVDTFAATELPRIELAFDRFYSDFEQFQVNRATWENVYGQEYGAVYRYVPAAEPMMDSSSETVQPMPDNGAAPG